MKFTRSLEEKADRGDERVAAKTDRATANLRRRRQLLIVALATPKPGKLQSLLDETRELFYIDQAIASLSTNPTDDVDVD